MTNKFVIANRPESLNHRSARKAGANQLRIIGGQWRSRRLSVAAVPGLRPTPERVRETLFNWLQSDVAGSRCLDLFAGSGALGLEALSRGAASVIFVEKNKQAYQQLQANIHSLQAEGAQLFRHDALTVLKAEQVPFDLIFLDPPFHQDWPKRILDLIVAGALLHPASMVYLEHEMSYKLNPQDWGLEIYRETHAGEVYSCLLKPIVSTS